MHQHHVSLAHPRTATRVAATTIIPIVALALLATQTAAQEWAQFRGRSAQGIAAAPLLPATFTKQNVRWRVPTRGTGHSSPVLWGKRLFLTRKSEKAATRDVVCFDADSGKELWSRTCSYDRYRLHEFNSAASSTPAVDAKAIYILWSSGQHLHMLALDHAGKKLWQRQLGAFKSLHGCGASPILHDDRVILANDNMSEESFLMALDKETGEVAWRIERHSAERRTTYSCPILYQRPDQSPLVLFTSQHHGITAVNPKSGKIRWEIDVGFTLRVVATSCLVDEGLLFCSSGTGSAGKKAAFVTLPKDEDEEPEVRGRMRRAIPYVPSSLALHGRLFTFSDGGIASCLRAKDGEVVWRQRLPGGFFSSPVSNGRVIYIPTKAGSLVSIASGEKFKELGSFDLGGPTFSTPAIADNVIYLRTDTELIALGRARKQTVVR